MLYIISTPIGNLKDISLRAVETLETLDVLLCEDTRKTGMLLKLLGIKNQVKLVSFYDEVEMQKIPEVIRMLKEGWEVGIVTDAGTPLISDPGWRLIERVQKENIAYTAIPGPSAVVNALVLSGLPAARFCFLGFLPKKSGERKKILEEYINLRVTKVVYESPLRVKRLIEEIKAVYGENAKIKVVKEMTKKFESVEENPVDDRGEAVVVWG